MEKTSSSPKEERKIKKLRIRYAIVIEKEGEQVADDTLITLLRELDSKGSLLAAAKTLGIPYSRAWESISRAERILGEPLIETWRGGAGRGGAKLTNTGRELLELYRKAKSRLPEGTDRHLIQPYKPLEADLIVAHSSDPLLDIVIERLKGENVKIESLCIGSVRALAMLSLGETDVSCSHLYDPDRGVYNRTYLDKLWVENPIKIIGYKRQIVLAYRRGIEFKDLKEALHAIAQGEISIINRNTGSGTRALFEHLLNTHIGKFNPESIRGYNNVAYTHEEAVKKVAAGIADATLTLRYAAEKYGLEWIHATWESYECYTTRDRWTSPGVSLFTRTISSKWFYDMIDASPGYTMEKEPDKLK